MKIRRRDGKLVDAQYIRHLRTLTGTSTYGSSTDIDLFRLQDGAEIECASPDNDGRAVPYEQDATIGHYDGYAPGA